MIQFALQSKFNFSKVVYSTPAEAWGNANMAGPGPYVYKGYEQGK